MFILQTCLACAVTCLPGLHGVVPKPTLCPKKETKVFCNIFYKTQAILIKFGGYF